MKWIEIKEISVETIHELSWIEELSVETIHELSWIEELSVGSDYLVIKR